MTRPAIIILGLSFVIAQCSKQENRSLLQGTWKTDSIYSYYNGFGFTRHDIHEEPLHHYERDGSLKMILNKESRSFLYTVQGDDSVIHLSTENRVLSKFQILELNHKFMALKRERKPVFGGAQQQRYEIRYFSRTE